MTTLLYSGMRGWNERHRVSNFGGTKFLQLDSLVLGLSFASNESQHKKLIILDKYLSMRLS